MRNKELKQKIEELKAEPVSLIFLSDVEERIKRYERWLKTNDITIIFSEIISTRFSENMIIEITDKPLEYSSKQVAYDMDGYRIEWRNKQKLHILGLSKKEFKYIKDRFEAKCI